YRTYARLRIEVRNYSSCPLSIYDLKFSDNFSKDKTYFCRMPGAADIFDGLDYTPGAPDVSYGESIIAFPYYNTHLRNTDTGEVSTPGPDELYYIVEDTDPVRGREEIGTGQPTVEQGQTAAVFDAYISASRDDNGDKYRYTIELGYDDAADYPSYSVAGTPLSAADAGSDRYYALKVASASQWLYEASDSRLLTEKLDVGGVQSRVSGGDGSFVWQLRKSDNGYRLQNAGTGDCIYVDQYFSAVCSGMMSSEFSVSGKAGLFTFGYAMNSWYTYYLAYNDKDSSMSLDYSASSFELYPVEYGNKARKRVEVVLQTIDDRTSAVADVTEIRRNDFVNVLIEVSYNPDRGDFEFEVQPWVADKGGDITFN
ncbi:MAG: hypothetical protein K2J33_01135, partial [Alistipes sp.]|nr:hypothetical protein [Alistipes sp.]